MDDNKILISLLIPCMNRFQEFKRSIETIIETANASAPVEIVLVDYSSRDPLQKWIEANNIESKLAPGVIFVNRKLTGPKHYNSAHARNLCAVASSGDYLIQLSTDALPKKEFVSYIRKVINKEKPDWMCEDTKFDGQYCGRFIVCKRQEFFDAGGYDERFNLYGPEDKDICFRLHRRGGKFLTFPQGLASEIPTLYADKTRNLDHSQLEGKMWDKREMSHLMIPIFEENNKKGVLVANTEKGWGKWT